MEYLNHVFAVLGLSVLCVLWITVQFMAKTMKTKNLFESQGGCSGACANSTVGASCESRGENCKQNNQVNEHAVIEN